MNEIIEKSNILILQQTDHFTRSLTHKINWDDRLIGIVGARGTGKTTLLLQRLKEEFGVGQKAVYISLDDLFFAGNTLTDFVTTFRQQGGKALFIDEVHKYPDWAREIKNIYDFDRSIKIIFTGSSIIDIIRQNMDLSRRAIQYELTGLSFREYLEFSGILNIKSFSLEDLLHHTADISSTITPSIRPLEHFGNYLTGGYYPFFAENQETYHIRIEQMVRMTVENDIQFMEGYDPSNTRKLYQLLFILAANVPFKPNISKLSEKIGIHRTTFMQYLHYIHKARLINLVSTEGKSISQLQKPDKIYLENTNLHTALARSMTNKGSMRESFFLNQLRNAGHHVSLPSKGDFFVDDHYVFEIGGKGKSGTQLRGLDNSYIAADDIEIGAMNRIPLWLFGFLY